MGQFTPPPQKKWWLRQKAPFIFAEIPDTLQIVKCNMRIQITVRPLWLLLPSSSVVDSKHLASRVKALLCGEVKATWPASAYSATLRRLPPPTVRFHPIYSWMFATVHVGLRVHVPFFFYSLTSLACSVNRPLAAHHWLLIAGDIVWPLAA